MVPFGLFLYFLRLRADMPVTGPFRFARDWAPSLGMNLSFNADGLGLLFALLISGIGALVVLYSGEYLKGHPQLGRWHAFLFLFMGSMLGVVLSDNIYTLFVFWELTSIASYLLIGFNHEEEDARAAALQALLVTGAGGLALLAGLVLLSIASGTTEISEMAARSAAVKAHPLYLPALALVLAGAFTKSAQFPFHFWLPRAMAAPTPASAYLHSSTMVKAGVYLLARMSPVLGGTAAWQGAVVPVGLATLLVGAWLAWRQDLLKRLLAWSTVGALGLLTMLIGLGGDGALHAAAAFLVAHALYKAALFLTAGIIDHETGERDVSRLGGLAGAMPLTAAAAAVAALSMAGLPPFFGFAAKEAVYGVATGGPLPLVTASATVAAGVFFLVTAAAAVWKPFFGAPVATPRKPHGVSAALWLGPVVLGVCSLAAGLMPGLADDWLVRPAVAAAGGGDSAGRLVLWHGFTPALGLGVLTVALGLALWRFRTAARRVTAFPAVPAGALDAERLYDGALRALVITAGAQTRVLQNGRLRYYLLMVLSTVLLLAWPVLLTHVDLLNSVFLRHLAESLAHLRFYELGLAGLLTVSIAAAVHSRTRLAAVAALGMVGYGISLVFVLYGAPDLAMTQFVIETLTVILMVLTFHHLPEFRAVVRRASMVRDFSVAAGVGVLMTALTLVAADTLQFPPISEYFNRHSLDLAHGRNVVNVILVDFRGLDTMGEITVLGVAAAGAFALLKLRPGRGGGR